MTDQQKTQRDTESMILQAAEKEFLEKGYAGAKTTSIAEAAGVTHAMLHYYFRTKDKLFEKIVAEKMGNLSEVIFGDVSDSHLPLKEKITQGITRHLDFISANRSLPRFIFNEIYNNPERMGMVRDTVFTMASKVLGELQASIDEEARAGKCRRVDARMLLLDIVSLNLFPFLAAPIVDAVFGADGEDFDAFLEKRREENIRTILGKLDIK